MTSDRDIAGGRGSQGRRTQQAIYESAIRAFATKGYAGASMRSLAAEVGIEVGSLYRHFASKEELLFNIVKSAGEDFYNSLVAAVSRADDDPVSRLRALVAETARYHAVHRAQSFVGTIEIRELSQLHHKQVIKQRNQVEELFKSLLIECIEVGYYPADLHVTITANFLLAVGTNVANWFDASGPLTEDQVAQLASDFAVPVRSVRPGASAARRGRSR